ncbi:MAG: hypothetical protein V1722_04100, partial [Candidatus Micrarchaeota archaeon]
MKTQTLFITLLILCFLALEVSADTRTPSCANYCANGTIYSSGNYSSRSSACVYASTSNCQYGCATDNVNCAAQPAGRSSPSAPTQPAQNQTPAQPAPQNQTPSQPTQPAAQNATPTEPAAQVEILGTCFDDDNGKNYEVKAKANYISKDGASNGEDHCTSETNLFEYYCNASGIMAHETHDCKQDGKNCLGGVCTEKEQICTDNDGGINETASSSALVEGVIKFANGEKQGWNSKIADKCISSTILNESICKTGATGKGYSEYVSVNCANAGKVCKNGACVTGENICKEDDDGINYKVKSHISGINETTGSTVGSDDHCNGNTILREYYCNGNQVTSVDYDCAKEGKYCALGVCLAGKGCEDSDAGLDYLANTSVYTSEYIANTSVITNWKDKCTSTVNLVEYSCENGKKKETEFDCSKLGLVCKSEGKCASISGNVVQMQDIGQMCNGCLQDAICIPIGTRFNSTQGQNSYCNWNNAILSQKLESESCQNSYECVSNICTNGKCMDLEKQQ